MQLQKNKYDNYFWDLDGTLSDSKEGIFNSILYSLDKLGIDPPSEEVLESFIGPPLYKSYMKHWYPNEEAKAQKAVDYYREYYQDKGIYENQLFPGIKELLEHLKSNGANLIVATAKPTPFAKIVLEHSGIDHLFSAVYGSMMDGSRASKVEIIRDIFSDSPGLKQEKCIMIGDRYYDLEGANHHKIDGLGVLYGSGSEKELSNCKPIGLINKTEDYYQYL